MTRQQVLSIEGVAERSPTYAQKLMDNIGVIPAKLTQTFHGDLFQVQEDIFNRNLLLNPLWNKEHLLGDRGFINQLIMDMEQQKDTILQGQIRERIMSSLDLDADKYHFVLHSWGSVTFFEDIMHLIPSSKMGSITTVGCAYHLYDLGKTEFSSIVTDMWTNFYATDDIIGIPLRSIYKCRDVEVTDVGPPTWLVGGEEIAATIWSHTSFWGSRQVANHIKEQVYLCAE